MSTVSLDVRHTAGEFALQAHFTVSGHGISVLSGPSGAGKSLTLALIAGLRRPDTGRITLNDRIVDDVEQHVHVRCQDRHLGMVFQDALLLPHRNAIDNVALAVRGKHTRAKRRQLAAQALEEVGVAQLAKQRPRTLSGGQRQRVALARALVASPQLLLLDEPFSALDRPVRRELRALVRRVVDARAIPALLVTHDQEELDELADQIVVFEPGHAHAVRHNPQRPAPKHQADTARPGADSTPDCRLSRIAHETGALRPSGDPKENPVKLSARNQLTGTVTSINEGAAIANVELDVNGQRLVASITVEAARELGLTNGKPVTAIIKASDVILGTTE